MSLRDELIQVAAVAIAILTDLETGSTEFKGDVGGRAHDRIGRAVVDQRYWQEERWGAQHHSIAEWLSILGEEYGEACKAANDEVIFPKEDDDG